MNEENAYNKNTMLEEQLNSDKLKLAENEAKLINLEAKISDLNTQNVNFQAELKKSQEISNETDLLKTQNKSLREEYEALKEKLYAVEKAYSMESENLKQSEKILKEKCEKLSNDYKNAMKERDKLKHEINMALNKCQESINLGRSTPNQMFSGQNTKNYVKVSGGGNIENQMLMNITPIEKLHEPEEKFTDVLDRWGRGVDIQDKYRAEQFKNKMLLVEIKNSKKYLAK